MARIRVLLCVLASFAAAASPGWSHAREDAARDRARADPLGGDPPDMVFEVEDPRHPGWTVVSFHFWRANPPSMDEATLRVWMARKTERRLSRTPITVTYADVRRCPAITDVLTMSRRLTAPQLKIDGLATGERVIQPDERETGGIIIDGANFAYQANDQELEGGGLASVALTGDERSDLASWIRLSMASLEDCWSASVPVPSDSR